MARRYWAFEEIPFEYEGFYVPEFYKALRNFIADKGYMVHEFKYIHGYYGGEVNAAVGGWLATKEVESKFVMNGFYVYWKLVWRYVDDPNGDKKVPYGNVKIVFRGYVNLDYLGNWEKKPILKLFLPIKLRYFYKNKLKFHMQQVRSDVESIIKDLHEFVNFLPKIS